MFPKLMKNSLEKISLIQILGNKSFIESFVFLKKATTTVSIIFQPVFTSSFELGFLCVFIHCQPIEHSHSSMFRRLSECKCETFFQRPCPCNLGSQTRLSFNIVVFNYSNSNEIVFLCMGVIYYLFSVKVKIYLKKFQQTVAKILS